MEAAAPEEFEVSEDSQELGPTDVDDPDNFPDKACRVHMQTISVFFSSKKDFRSNIIHIPYKADIYIYI